MDVLRRAQRDNARRTKDPSILFLSPVRQLRRVLMQRQELQRIADELEYGLPSPSPNFPPFLSAFVPPCLRRVVEIVTRERHLLSPLNDVELNWCSTQHSRIYRDPRWCRH